MSTRLTLTISAILILAVALAGILLWNQLREQMASHWNEQNQVFYILMVSIIAAGLVSVMYSYVLWKREEKTQ